MRSDVPSIIGDGDVRLLVVSLPSSSWDTNPTITLYIPSFLSQGGKLLLLGDGETGEADSNARIRSILGSIPDHGITLNAEQVNVNGSCTDAPTTDIQGDPLTAGLSSWYIGQATTVSGGDALVNFTPDGGSTTATLGAVSRLQSGGEVIVFGDNEGFLGGLFHDVCDGIGTDIPAAHEALWVNLYADTSAAVDGDNDGYDSDVDCNDNNPAVNPGADEECNGVDDNCDGTIDEGCGDDDDATGDDDDDDATTGDDDDDATGLLDDDDATDDPFRDDSEWNSCACGGGEAVASARPAGWLLAVLPLGGLLGWRRRRT
ncbi:MAG: hypothetical protein KDA24_25960 [Deltaproteobacteria bacterium]|nr:hypothetical protein [Deltaproteobacteria bacterium]